jgi:SAM-dependent methyltransferase
MIAFASSHIPPNQTNLRFEIGDVRQLPYKNEFDLVVSFNALHWVPEQEAALASIHESLKHNAQFLGRFVPEGDRKCLEDVIEDVRHRPRWAEYFVSFRTPYIHFTAQEYRTLAERCGFQVVRLHVEDKAWDFKTREMFVAFARATFVEWTRYLPEKDWDAFVADVLDNYQLLAADKPSEVNTFKFYQMEVVLRSMDH